MAGVDETRRTGKELIRTRKPEAFLFRDDGETPNNPAFPLLLYRDAVALSGELDPAAVLEEIFTDNGWGKAWRDGIHGFLHFHTRTHEVLGVALGEARVQFGGAKGKTIAVKAGDVVVLPAGTGHQRIDASRELLVVGAYPPDGQYDQPRPDEANGREARARIAKVRAPRTDPLYGPAGPLVHHWR